MFGQLSLEEPGTTVNMPSVGGDPKGLKSPTTGINPHFKAS